MSKLVSRLVRLESKSKGSGGVGGSGGLGGGEEGMIQFNRILLSLLVFLLHHNGFSLPTFRESLQI